MEEPTKVVVLLSSYCLILLSAYSAFQNIVTKIHSDEGDISLGPFALAINFVSSLIMNSFVSRFRGISEKWLVTLPSLAYCFFYLTGFFIEGKPEWVKYLLTGVGAIIGGIFEFPLGIYWSLYSSNCPLIW